MGYTRLMGKVYYKGVHFDLLYPMCFKNLILHLVRPLVTWVEIFKKIQAWADLEPHF